MSAVMVKICGLTRESDVDASVEAGADLLGFVFAPSPRQLGTETARGLCLRVPEHVGRVGLFMDQSRKFIMQVLSQVPLDLLQFHGGEDNAFCRSFEKPFVKAVAMGAARAPGNFAEQFPDARALLYDSHEPGQAGGSGRSFDWSRLPRNDRRLWLAGGLNPDNVAAAVRQCCPRAVDVSSGVEASPGVKDHRLVRAFISAARSLSGDENR